MKERNWTNICINIFSNKKNEKIINICADNKYSILSTNIFHFTFLPLFCLTMLTLIKTKFNLTKPCGKSQVKSL